MKTKIVLPLLAVLLVTLGITGAAFASTDLQTQETQVLHPNHRALIGQIIEIGEDQFTAEIVTGEMLTVVVNEDTRYRSRREDAPETLAFADLEVGMWVTVANVYDDNNDFIAKLVVILPEDFDSSRIPEHRVIGSIQQVTGTGFDLLTLQGESQNFTMDDSTRFVGGLAGQEDLALDLRVVVLASQQEDGTLLAKMVAANPDGPVQLARTTGKVIDVGADSFTLFTRGQEEQTFTISTDTRFVSRGNALAGLADVEKGMALVVLTDREDADLEAPTAKVVTYMDGKLLSQARARGEVQSVGSNTLTLTGLDGETLTFSLDEATRVRGRGINSLDQVEVGMKALVFYQQTDEDTLAAQGIIILQTD